ncbi:helix-turn-helix domain-containing protein [Spirillospora sp. NPDC048911]|uniref:helix-turn-helix domain-containing protein n=1 Tax=Spirillospora sp. NPDC048911 TaxID=3364527 RepID=UPI003720E311
MPVARKAPGARLAVERRDRKWSKEYLARRIIANLTGPQVPSLSTVVSYVTRWEASKGITERYELALAAALDIDPGELFDLLGDLGGSVESPIPSYARDDDVRRRAALQLIAAVGAGAAVPPGALEGLLSGIDEALSLNTDLEEWERVVDDYGRQIYRQSFDALVAPLTTDIIAVGHLLKKGRPPHEQAGLLRVSAGLSGVLAETLSNLGDDRATRRTWSTARRAADASGDRALQVWVRGRAAQHASWAGSSHHAVMSMVNEAADIASGTPTSGLARAYAAGAYMAAFHGDENTARGNLTRLKRTFDQLSHSSSEPTVLDFQEGQLRWNEAYVRTTIGEKHAVAAVEDAQSLYPPTAKAPIINLHLMRAIHLVQRNDVREGLDLAMTSLRGRPRPVMATRQLVGQILNTLPGSAQTLPGARDLRALAAGT